MRVEGRLIAALLAVGVVAACGGSGAGRVASIGATASTMHTTAPTTAPSSHSSGPSSAAAVTPAVPPVGVRVSGDPYGLSGGRAIGVPVDIGFGLTVAPPTAVPRRSMTDAYGQFLNWSRSPDGLTFQGHPTISLAMATRANFKPSHAALVWVVRWPGICVAAAPATFLKRDHEPTARPCQYWSVFSDTTGQAVTAGSG